MSSMSDTHVVDGMGSDTIQASHTREHCKCAFLFVLSYFHPCQHNHADERTEHPRRGGDASPQSEISCCHMTSSDVICLCLLATAARAGPAAGIHARAAALPARAHLYRGQAITSAECNRPQRTAQECCCMNINCMQSVCVCVFGVHHGAELAFLPAGDPVAC